MRRRDVDSSAVDTLASMATRNIRGVISRGLLWLSMVGLVADGAAGHSLTPAQRAEIAFVSCNRRRPSPRCSRQSRPPATVLRCAASFGSFQPRVAVLLRCYDILCGIVQSDAESGADAQPDGRDYLVAAANPGAHFHISRRRPIRSATEPRSVSVSPTSGVCRWCRRRPVTHSHIGAESSSGAPLQ